MNKKLFTRKAHRYLGLFVSLQLLAWTLGGIWFAWNDIDNIHGDYLIKPRIEKSTNQNLISAQIAINTIADFETLTKIEVIDILDEPVYKISYKSIANKEKMQLINALSARTVNEISEQQAIKIAKLNASFDAEVSGVELITATDSHHEYRSKPLPAYAITFDYPKSPTFYISVKSGELISVRHNNWRIFDFFWMLHTMDYEGRDDFGNWLLKIFSILALITSLTGIIVFFHSSAMIRKIRRNR